jgi:hypothetical protein
MIVQIDRKQESLELDQSHPLVSRLLPCRSQRLHMTVQQVFFAGNREALLGRRRKGTGLLHGHLNICIDPNLGTLSMRVPV